MTTRGRACDFSRECEEENGAGRVRGANSGGIEAIRTVLERSILTMVFPSAKHAFTR